MMAHSHCTQSQKLSHTGSLWAVAYALQKPPSFATEGGHHHTNGSR